MKKGVILWSWGYAWHGGGIKGAAHIGALKAFEEKGLEFEYISGASSGSIVATLYASGYTADEIYSLFQKYAKKIKYVEWKNIFKLIGGLICKRQIVIDGLNSGKVIENIVVEACQKKGICQIKDIKKKLLISSVDLEDGTVYLFSSFSPRKETIENRNIGKGYSNKIEYIREIPIGKAVRASCSFPGVFSPCNYREHKLVDGGIRENVPWKELKANGVDKVISIVFPKKIKYKENKNIIDVISGSIELMGQELSNYELDGADYLLKIDTANTSLLDTSKLEYFYKKGYEQTKKSLQNGI